MKIVDELIKEEQLLDMFKNSSKYKHKYLEYNINQNEVNRNRRGMMKAYKKHYAKLKEYFNLGKTPCKYGIVM